MITESCAEEKCTEATVTIASREAKRFTHIQAKYHIREPGSENKIARALREHVVEPSGKFDALTFVVVAVAPTDDLAQSLLDSASRAINKLLI